MRKLFALPLPLVSLMFAAPAHAEGTTLGELSNGEAYYINLERIREHSGSVFYWYLSEYLKPDEYGDFSTKTYNESDTQGFRYRDPSFSFHKAPMGEESEEVIKPDGRHGDWSYPRPESPDELLPKVACYHVAD